MAGHGGPAAAARMERDVMRGSRKTPYEQQCPGGDPDALVETHAPLVKRIAYHLSARLPPSVMVDDLIQAGMLGLLDAARQYDPSQGASFETYATIRVRGAMLDELRRNDWAPKSVHRKARELADAIHRIEARTGRDARDQEVADELGISLEEYHQILHDAATCRIFNFEEIGLNDDALGDLLRDRSAGPVENLQWEQLRRHLAEAVASLPERERLIVSLYYDGDFNLREVGAMLGVSESRISQLLSQAHLRLRARLQDHLGAFRDHMG